MNYLEFLRRSRGLSQVELAGMIGLHPVTYCRVERGWLTRPPADAEARLMEVFGPQWTFARLMERVDVAKLAS